MQFDVPRPGATLLRRSLAAATVGVLGSLVAGGLTQAFVVAALAVGLVNALPGVALTLGIQYLGSAAQLLGLAAALGLSLLLYGAAAGAGVRVGRAYDDPFGGGLLAAIGCWSITALVTGLPLTALGAALPLGVAVAVLEVDAGATAGGEERRRLLRAFAGAAGLVGLGGALGWEELGDVLRRNGAGDGDGSGGGGGRGPPADGGVVSAAERREARRRIAAARERELDVEGLAGLVSEAGDFYEVDINAVNPRVDPADWSLSITGAVERERTYGFEDVVGMATEHRFVTLRCVGERLNGHKLDNALWTGVPVARLLAEARPLQAGCCVMLRADDGYFEEFPLEALRPGLLAYGMNGAALPRAHGAPLRALVPGHWGEINVKWLTEIEVLREEAKGYWEQRGWHGTGPVNTVAKLWTVNRDGGRIEVAGHAYAGVRGIDRVEVSTDGGDSWADATLSDPIPGTGERAGTPTDLPPSPADVWRQWAFAFEPTRSEHEVVVRAVDGTGAVQPREHHRPFPSGATGWVSKTIRR